MAQLANTPRSETVLRLEARKSFSFALKVVDGNGRPMDLTGTQLSLSVSERRGPRPALYKVVENDGVAAGAGYARFDLQALDLTLAPGEYPFAITLLDNGYSSLLVKGFVEIIDNADAMGMSGTYSSGRPASALQVTLQGQVIVVQAGAVRPPGEEVFTDRDRDKLDDIEAGAQTNVNADWRAGPNTPGYIRNRPLSRLVPEPAAAGMVLVSTDTGSAWVSPGDVVLRSPNGTAYKLRVADNGALAAARI